MIAQYHGLRSELLLSLLQSLKRLRGQQKNQFFVVCGEKTLTLRVFTLSQAIEVNVKLQKCFQCKKVREGYACIELNFEEVLVSASVLKQSNGSVDMLFGEDELVLRLVSHCRDNQTVEKEVRVGYYKVTSFRGEEPAHDLIYHLRFEKGDQFSLFASLISDKKSKNFRIIIRRKEELELSFRIEGGESLLLNTTSFAAVGGSTRHRHYEGSYSCVKFGKCLELIRPNAVVELLLRDGSLLLQTSNSEVTFELTLKEKDGRLD